MNQSGWFHSVGCCQGQSISPGSQQSSRGCLETERRRRVPPHPQRFKGFSSPLFSPSERSRVAQRMYVGWNEREDELKNRSRGRDVFSLSLWMRCDLVFTFARLVCTGNVFRLCYYKAQERKVFEFVDKTFPDTEEGQIWW